MSATPTFPSGVAVIRAKITPTETTSAVVLYDNTGTNAVRVEGLGIASDDAAAQNIQFSILAGGVTYPISTVNVPIASGTNGSAARVNALPSIGVLAPDGVYDVWVGAGEKLQANSLATLTAGDTITITGRVRLYN